MPIRDYMCPECKHVKENVFEGFEFGKHICEDCKVAMHILPCTVSIAPTSETIAYRMKKDRFERRNKRIEGMSPQQQQGFKNIIDKTGGQRYIP